MCMYIHINNMHKSSMDLLMFLESSFFKINVKENTKQEQKIIFTIDTLHSTTDNMLSSHIIHMACCCCRSKHSIQSFRLKQLVKPSFLMHLAIGSTKIHVDIVLKTSTETCPEYNKTHSINISNQSAELTDSCTDQFHRCLPLSVSILWYYSSQS